MSINIKLEMLRIYSNKIGTHLEPILKADVIKA